MHAFIAPLVVISIVLGCGDRSPPPHARWPEVERLAAPTVPAADGTLLQRALDRVEEDDVPEAAFDDVIAWHQAGGGLPWRAGREIADGRSMSAMRLGRALVERRGTDLDAVLAALYLGHRLRAEAPLLIDVVIGFELADLVRAHRAAERPGTVEIALAPTEAEVRRGLAADAVHFDSSLASTGGDDEMIRRSARNHYVRLNVDLPADRAGFVARIEAATKAAQQTDLGSVIISERLPRLVREMFAKIDAYRAWLAAP